jgi:hypothetical protein
MVASLIARLPAVCRVIGPVVDMHKHARSLEVIARHAETKARIQAGSPGAASGCATSRLSTSYPAGFLAFFFLVVVVFPPSSFALSSLDTAVTPPTPPFRPARSIRPARGAIGEQAEQQEGRWWWLA